MFGSTVFTTGATSFATNGTFSPNLKSAGISAGITALFAGIEGGIRTANDNRNFWTGEKIEVWQPTPVERLRMQTPKFNKNVELKTYLSETRPLPRIRNISRNGINFITNWEGYGSNVYLDVSGNPTIGYGHLVMPGENFSNGITQTQALHILQQDMASVAIGPINRWVSTPLTQWQFDALVSYVYNTGSLSGTNLLRYLNNGAFQNAALQMDIITSGGVTYQGLINRRLAEQNLFLYGIY